MSEVKPRQISDLERAIYRVFNELEPEAKLLFSGGHGLSFDAFWKLCAIAANDPERLVELARVVKKQDDS